MATTEITETNFEGATSSGTIVLDFWADWCGPCKQFAPVFSKVSADYPDVTFGKVDVDANPELAGAFGITAIPTLVVIKDKKVLLSQPGAMNESALRAAIDKALRPQRVSFQF